MARFIEAARGGRRPAALGLLASLVAVAVAAALPVAPAMSKGSSFAPRVLTSWPFVAPSGSFVESLALGRDGYLYASSTTWSKKSDADVGQIWKVSLKTGEKTAFGPRIQLGPATLTGIAFDRKGRLFVGRAAFGGSSPSAVYRVDALSVVRVLTLPPNAFPNGLAFHGDDLYITDSARGAIWKARPGVDARLTKPWLTSSLLMPGNPKKNPADHGIGANGIAFRGASMYVGSYDRAAIVRVPVAPDGTPGKLVVVSKRPELKTVDGIAFDKSGDLWIVTNGPSGGRVEALSPSGSLDVLASNQGWLDYPTMPVVARTPSLLGSLYVANGSFAKGKPNVLVFSGPLLP